MADDLEQGPDGDDELEDDPGADVEAADDADLDGQGDGETGDDLAVDDGDEPDEDDDDADEEEDGDEDLADDDEVEYELDDWPGESRLLLDGLLTNQGIPHVWEAGTLVVRAEHEAATDEIVDGIDLVSVPALDPDAEKLAYEVGAWSDEQRSGLAERLGLAGIPYEWDEQGDLVVLEEDEARVEAVFDEFEEAEGDDLDAGLAEEDDGLAASQVLSDLFVSSDRLMHDARDPDGVLTLVDAAARARTISLPFGFERGVWDEILARAAGLSDEFERDGDDDDVIVERATDLRNLLRPFV